VSLDDRETNQGATELPGDLPGSLSLRTARPATRVDSLRVSDWLLGGLALLGLVLLAGALVLLRFVYELNRFNWDADASGSADSGFEFVEPN